MKAMSPEPSRLLIVEDDVRLCRLVKDYLETMGYAVSMAHTGPVGLAARSGQSPMAPPRLIEHSAPAPG